MRTLFIEYMNKLKSKQVQCTCTRVNVPLKKNIFGEYSKLMKNQFRHEYSQIFLLCSTLYLDCIFLNYSITPRKTKHFFDLASQRPLEINTAECIPPLQKPLLQLNDFYMDVPSTSPSVVSPL